ncbi:hypothetical protein [Providencia sp. PROV190]|uniref:hypothetical protein n=1 Tax=Providencia sp. PROV190 TaxID=2949891 RepID=UPI00234A7E12|nr:hypothetical protein [Providencia sp. PROV190]
MSTNSMLPSSLTFTLSREPVFYVRQREVLSNSIQISLVANTEFCVPLYTQSGDDNQILRELQAQGVDKLADSLQDSIVALEECHYIGAITDMIQDEISRCRAFAERLRKPIVATCLCDSCNDWPRGGCLSTCAAYDTSKSSQVRNHYHGDMSLTGRVRNDQ